MSILRCCSEMTWLHIFLFQSLDFMNDIGVLIIVAVTTWPYTRYLEKE